MRREDRSPFFELDLLVNWEIRFGLCSAIKVFSGQTFSMYRPRGKLISIDPV